MQILSLKQATLADANSRASTIVSACGYESRSSALVERISSNIKQRHALCFSEWSDVFSRKKNEEVFRAAGYSFEYASGADSDTPANLLLRNLQASDAPVVIDISSMTRAWHGGIVRALKTANLPRPVETFFAYVPARFSQPPRVNPANEIVAPVPGFASLIPPDLPLAAVIGLGYEKERALGLQQLLDPSRTILMVPRFRSRFDKFHPTVMKSNRDILEQTSKEWCFEYGLDEPVATFGLLGSLIAGLLPSYRIVLSSLGPKLFGILCFLLAARFPEVSVWRTSSGSHGVPKEIYPDLHHVIVFSVTWIPDPKK